MEQPPHRRPGIWRLVYFLASFYVAGTVVGGVALGWLALHASSAPIRSYEERNVRTAALAKSVEFRDVELTTPDGTVLRAWYMRPHESNGDAVILLHSISGNRVEMYDYGKWLVENHYSVLLADERHHGDSGGLTTYGVKEADDIHRWVDWIEANEPARCVYGLGESTGAAELLESLPLESRFCAVVGESANATFREEEYTRLGRLFHAGPWLGRTFFHPTVDIGFLYVRMLYGIDLEAASPAQAVVGIKTPILLIHGLDDTYIPPYNSDLIKAKNPAIVVWKVPGAVHVGAHAAAPQEFEHRVLEWFAEHSVADKPTSAPNSNR